MSFILDALRKSDQQRQRGAAPTLRPAPAMAVASRQPAFLSYGLFAAALLGAGIAIGWLRPWQAEQAPAPQSIAAKPPRSLPREAAPVTPPAIKREPAAEPRPLESVPARRTPPVAAKMIPAAPASEKSVDTGSGEQRVMTLAELPASMRDQIPKISISFHAYSAKPASRLVGINDRMLREGDSAAPDLRLEEITPDGMILNYKGTRFRHGVR